MPSFPQSLSGNPDAVDRNKYWIPDKKTSGMTVCGTAGMTTFYEFVVYNIVSPAEMIEFRSTTSFERGIIYKLLCESYAGLLESKPRSADEYKTDWKKADDDTFDNPDTIGRCVLISIINGEPIGSVSWDPRRIPKEGVIGQNCILPPWRGKGYGKQQIQKMLSIFRSRGTKLIKVSTDNYPLFIPAQKTCLSCGFKEVGRSHVDSYGGLELVQYEYKG
ncbi:GNAT family N-acetyltransferase [Thermodesulfovibrionales bacterium]|nr:GNAT family N-acetyltransferase [Thermodesulfovibrionales bacterium]MCL0039914.1 GNAT family N-acetyltransferase [Thermodesulfovibrionales bacterium]MCL0070996.1 GNAT family N-acetyltransferase [Thermodesulfovibrionales bacterium]MCL0086019.1 GNAT family N-acetyltransferase [Thermodesulfovibrionales bacterium]